jgi:hypothetical protein
MGEGVLIIMATDPRVTVVRPIVGVEFQPTLFQQAVTPDIEFPTEYPTLTIDNAVINNISGDLNGLPSGNGGSVALDDVTDVEATNPEDFSVLQYNSLTSKWVSVANTDFVDAVIDGGEADSEPDYVDAFDLDGGNA